MKFSIIVIVELIFSLVILSVPILRNSYYSSHPSVLGARELAQVDTSSPTNQPTDVPTDQPTPQSVDTSTPLDTSIPTDTSIPQDTNLEIATPSEIPNTETPIEMPTATSSESALLNNTEVSPLSNETISALDSSSVTTDTSIIDQNVIQQIETQNQQANNATTSETQVQSSVNAGQMDIQTIGSSLNSSSFANINLVTEDLSQHIDKGLNALDQTSSDQKPALKQNLTNLCSNVNISLRSAEEMVLEESEQDMEVVRAQCANILNQ